MNVTELARILRITPQELRDWMPRLGFDVGQKAIKINKNVANKIIKEWPILKKRIEREKRIKVEKDKEDRVKAQVVTSVCIPKTITVKEFTHKAHLQINHVLAELMKNGIFTSLNERIDYDTAWLVGSELGVEVILEKEKEGEAELKEDNKLKQVLDNEDKDKMLDRPPVIVVMGHVDHGKTKLLDAIRKTDVVAGEAGGITQHIGAYQVVRRNQLITFIDTPGHEAFTAMRSRGAKIADIAILVVAADDGVKPQTTEAFRIIEAAKIPYVVAINKIDKEGADINKTKQELSTKLNINPEDWGGKTICVPISALKGEGISDLLDMVLLSAEAESERIKANPKSSAMGTIIESHIDKGAGPIATLLVQNGTLNMGDNLIRNKISIGKVRALNNYLNEKINSAGPATPVQIIGFKNMPQVGDTVEVGTGERIKVRKVKGIGQNEANLFVETADDDPDVAIINVIIKSDVMGSAEAIEESLMKINNEKARIKVLNKGLGNISENDLKQAEASHAIVLGFNVKIPPILEESVREMGVEIKLYSIIYDLINDLKEKIKASIVIRTERVEIGRLKVKGIFRTEKNHQIVGGVVIKGELKPGVLIEIFREGEFMGDGKLVRLQSGKQDVTQVPEGAECGLEYQGKSVIAEGDELAFISEEEITS